MDQPRVAARWTFERSLTAADESGLHWAITVEAPHPGSGQLRYVEQRDGTILVQALTVHPAVSRKGLQRALVDDLAARHVCLLRWRLSDDLADGATSGAATFWSRVCRDHLVALDDADGNRLTA